MAKSKLEVFFGLAHPFLLAILPPLITYNEVKQLVLPEEILPGIGLCLIFVLCCLPIAWLITKNPFKASILTTALLAYCFAYRAIDYALNSLFHAQDNPLPAWVSLVAFTILGALLLPALVKNELSISRFKINVDHAKVSIVLTQVAGFLVLFNAATTLIYANQLNQLAQRLGQGLKQRAKLTEPTNGANVLRPDIYYVILDGFANSDALEQIWNFRDHQLDNYLRSKNFFLVPRAKSNYDRTEFSVGSAFAMEHMDFVPESEGKEFKDLNVFGRLMDNSELIRLLKSQGYRFVSVTDAANEHFFQADVNIHCTMVGDFGLALVGLTPIYGLEPYFHLIRNNIAHSRLEVYRRGLEACKIPGPKFVYVHCMLPHAPCLFDKDGKPRPLPKGSYMINWGTPDEYFQQWLFTEKMTIDWLEKFFEATQGKAVIIVQSDHGSGIPFANPHDWYNERMKILNAYYLPSVQNKGLYSTITPVNSFRLIFNDYFKTTYPMRPDRSLCAPDFSRPYYWVDVAKEMEYREAAPTTHP